MLEINWLKASSSAWYAHHGRFLLKRKQFGGRELFEVWDQDTLVYNTDRYFEFLKKITRDYKADNRQHTL